MFTTKITTLSQASLAGAILFIIISLTVSVAQARAQTGNVQTPVSSLAEVTLEPQAKLKAWDTIMVILGTGEKVKGNPVEKGDGTLSIKTTTNQWTFPRDSKIMTLRESEIFQVYQVKGTSRGRGALKGALIGAASATFVSVWIDVALANDGATFGEIALVSAMFAITGAAIGTPIGALVVSGEEKILIYERPVVSPHSGLKTGLLNFRDGRLSFAAPSICLRPDNSDRFHVMPSKKNTKHFGLVRVDF